MLKIGLTGNIASGKSEVEKTLIDNGYKVLCLDFVTHYIYENDLDFKKDLISIFNTSERLEVAKIVFNNKDKLKILENLIYPKIKKYMENFFIENKDKDKVIVSAAMLFESGFYKYFDKIIFVSANYDLRLDRLMKRNNLTIIEAKKRIQSQEDEDIKISKSDYIIYNNSTFEELRDNCQKVIKDINTL